MTPVEGDLTSSHPPLFAQKQLRTSSTSSSGNDSPATEREEILVHRDSSSGALLQQVLLPGNLPWITCIRQLF